MKFVPNGISSKAGRLLLHTQAKSPTILFAAGVVGVVGAAVLASRATLKLNGVLDHANGELKDAAAHSDNVDRDVKVIKIIAAREIVKLYGPAALVGGLSIAALTGSHRTLTKRNVALTAAYATVDKAFKEYRTRVTDAIGHDREQEIYKNANVREETIDKKTGKTKVTKKIGPDSASMYAVFFDNQNRNWNPTPEYNLMFIRCQQNTANDLLNSRGHVFLNEVYDSLGLDRTQAGAVVGWVKGGDGDQFVDFGVFNSPANNEFNDFVMGFEDCLLLDFNVDGVIYDKI